MTPFNRLLITVFLSVVAGVLAVIPAASQQCTDSDFVIMDGIRERLGQLGCGDATDMDCVRRELAVADAIFRDYARLSRSCQQAFDDEQLSAVRDAMENHREALARAEAMEPIVTLSKEVSAHLTRYNKTVDVTRNLIDTACSEPETEQCVEGVSVLVWASTVSRSIVETQMAFISHERWRTILDQMDEDVLTTTRLRLLQQQVAMSDVLNMAEEFGILHRVQARTEELVKEDRRFAEFDQKWRLGTKPAKSLEPLPEREQPAPETPRIADIDRSWKLEPLVNNGRQTGFKAISSWASAAESDGLEARLAIMCGRSKPRTRLYFNRSVGLGRREWDELRKLWWTSVGIRIGYGTYTFDEARVATVNPQHSDIVEVIGLLAINTGNLVGRMKTAQTLRASLHTSSGFKSYVWPMEGAADAINKALVPCTKQKKAKKRARGKSQDAPEQLDVQEAEAGTWTAPKRYFYKMPAYTDAAREARTEGSVTMQLSIDRNGNVTDVRPIRGLPSGVTEAAVEAARSWKYNPAKKNGQPVDGDVVETVTFSIEQ